MTPGRNVNGVVANSGLAADIEQMIAKSMRGLCEDSDTYDAVERCLARDIEALALSEIDPGRQLQGEIASWASMTFPGSDLYAVMAHLRDEVDELDHEVKASIRIGSVPERIAEEAADVMHLLFQIAERYGFDLLAETRRKFEINKQRTWGVPDARGVVRHVREGGS